MNYILEEIKQDIDILSGKDFLIKYILRSNNWYFSKHQDQTEEFAVRQMDTLKEILNKNIGVAFHNIIMVGSGKIGYSLSPQKNFKEFDDDSDIDIAVISSKLFEFIWEKLRDEYSIKYIHNYNTIASSIYRGFINEKNFISIDEVRPIWNDKINNANKEIQNKLSIYNSINYRIYRSWEDLESYHINGLRKLKDGISI